MAAGVDTRGIGFAERGIAAQHEAEAFAEGELLESYGLYTPDSKNQGCSASLNESKIATAAQQENRLPDDFVRITCVPQLRYLEIEALSDPQLQQTMTKKISAGASREAMHKLLERSGLFVPKNLNYTCKMPESTYELKVTQKPTAQGSD